METLINTPLTSDEIDFRVQSINKGGYATILAYKDARVDMKRLDDVYGAEYWQKKFELINGNLFCSVGIWNPHLSQWIWKQDVGTESNTEKEKGQASDAFKRACFNLGIGRELYDYPAVQIKLNANEFELKGDKCYPTFNFKLKQWIWESLFNEQKQLIKLSCKDNNGTVRFTWNKGQKDIPVEEKKEPDQRVDKELLEASNKLKSCKTVEELAVVYMDELTPQYRKLTLNLKNELKTKLQKNA